jgi:ATP-dependent DNA helicase RecG
MDEFSIGKSVSRHNRNRRIGEFLKEIDLAEKKSTGITKILNALKNNGSPPPEFKTDEDRNYLIVTVYKHEAFESHETVNDIVNETVNDIVNRQSVILVAVKENTSITIKQLVNVTGISQATINRELKLMKQNSMIRRVGSDKTGHWEIIE